MPEPGFADLYRPWPKQAEALWLLGCTDQPPPDSKPVNQLLYGGQAGPGKSTVIRMHATYKALHWPGSQSAIFRKTNEDVIKNHVNPMRKEIPESLATFNWNRMELQWVNGSTTEFHQCFDDHSHEEYVGYEWPGGVNIDESTLLHEDAINLFFSRVRGPTMLWKNMILATNAGGRSNAWHRRNFINGRTSGVPFLGPPQMVKMPDGTVKIVRFRHCFLKAELSDNPSLPYAETMAGLLAISDPWMRRAQAFGDWDQPSGQFFATFEKRVHVIRPFIVPRDWRVWRGVDWGFSAPFACVWLASNPLANPPAVYVIKEHVQSGVPTPDQARLIKMLGADLPPARFTMADPSMWRKTKGVGPSEAQEYSAAGVTLTRANNNRHMGWARIHHLLAHDPDHPPRLFVFDTCTKLIEQLSELEIDAKDPEDIKEPTNLTDMRDDVLDACLVAGTMISTTGPLSDGVRIEDIKEGDLVWTRQGPKRVLRAWLSSPSSRCLELRTSRDHRITATPEHQFWVRGKGWTPLRDLVFEPEHEDVLLTNDLDLTLVTSVVEAGSFPVYDLEVEGAHEFFANGVLVHNCRYSIMGVGAANRNEDVPRSWQLVDRAREPARGRR